MDIADKIRELRESTGETRKEFSIHTGIPVRTLEDWEAGRRTPPEYIPRLIAYQLEFEKMVTDINNTFKEKELERESNVQKMHIANSDKRST